MEAALNIKPKGSSNMEMITVVGVIFILLIMIIHLPAIILDFLLALNITLAVTILLIAMYTLKSLDFSIFPSLLLRNIC